MQPTVSLMKVNPPELQEHVRPEASPGSGAFLSWQTVFGPQGKRSQALISAQQMKTQGSHSIGYRTIKMHPTYCRLSQPTGNTVGEYAKQGTDSDVSPDKGVLCVCFQDSFGWGLLRQALLAHCVTLVAVLCASAGAVPTQVVLARVLHQDNTLQDGCI